eukprot:GHVO01039136.1.p1 GENE.GHVO01039136.1~~GHVO01039136.1.p1  ORF type:complete len:289 (-),score=43.96 GHVO01039136.1:1289-2098(-)
MNIFTATISHDNTCILSGSNDGVLSRTPVDREAFSDAQRLDSRWAVFQAEFRKNNTEIGIGAYEDGKVRLFDFRKSDGLITLRSLPLKVTGACWYPKPNCNIYGYAGRNESGIGDLRGVLPIPIHQHYQPINRLVKWGSGDKDTTDEISSVGPPRLECPPAMSALYDPPLENGREEERRKQRLRDNRRRNRAFAEMFNGGDGGVLDASDNDTPPPSHPCMMLVGGPKTVYTSVYTMDCPPPLSPVTQDCLLMNFVVQLSLPHKQYGENG